MDIEKIVPYLFMIILAFVTLNLILSFSLSLVGMKGLWKRLATYWFCVLFVFALQSIPKSPLEIALFISASYLPLTILGSIPFLQFKEKFPLKLCMAIYAVSIPAVVGIYELGAGFTAFALPISIGASAPLLAGTYVIIKNWKQASVPQRFLLLPFICFIIHNFNFAFFRMIKETQLWGWCGTFAIYQTLGILLPAIVIEQTKRTENQRLSDLIDQRTTDLKNAVGSLKIEVEENKELVKVVLHDICNPLTSLLGRLFLMKSQKTVNKEGESFLENAMAAGEALRAIIKDVRDKQEDRLRTSYKIESGNTLGNCVSDLKQVYSSMLEDKDIELNINCSLNSGHKFVIEEGEALRTSVLSNLISNAIKFSYPKSEINIDLYEMGNQITIDVQDFGVGIKNEVLECVNAGINPSSTPGTNNEKGTGFGLLLAKTFIIRNTGRFLINPEGVRDSGTLIRIQFTNQMADSMISPPRLNTKPAPELSV